jgi:hypothetical protein
MKNLGIRTGMAMLVLVFMISAAYAADSSVAPDGFMSISGVTQINPGTEGVKKILLIEDQLPWGLNANHEVLTALGLPHDMVTAAGLPNVVWNDYSQVIVSSIQPRTFHDALRPYISPGGALYNWVSAGGVLNFHGAMMPGNDGNWTLSYNLPGGISGVFDAQNDVTVTGPAAPLPPAKGPYRAITDADLDNWNYATHGYFKYVGGDVKPSLVVVTLTIAGAPSKPVYVLYKFGKGAVLTTQQPIEWGYGVVGTNSKYALYNDLLGGRKIDDIIS